MAGNEDATDGLPSLQTLFERAYDTSYQALYAYLFGRTADAEMAQDLLQETFLRVWRHRQKLSERTDEQQRAWMFAIARNLLIDSSRRRSVRSAAEDEFAQTAVVSLGMQKEVEIQVEKMEQIALLGQAIKQLPEDLRTVLVLGVLAEMSSTEIGAVLGKPAATVRYQMAKARKMLAGALHLLVPNDAQKERA
jgi:RNA polymerase sigma-70 factor, ECF subfamily